MRAWRWWGAAHGVAAAYALADGREAFERMASAEQFGKLVVRIAS